MRKFWQNNNTIQEDNGEIKNQSSKPQQKTTELQQNLAELDCEDTIINEKQQFGRVRNSMMKVLRAKYGNDVANRTLSRVNKRTQENHFKNKI